jgi:hypothetical protein
MPKERTHWIIADLIVGAVDPPLRRLLTAQRHSFYLGAVFPDTPFYALGMPEYRRLQQRSAALHGSDGQDPYQVLAEALDGLALSDGALAFVFGILTHMITDAAFHPLVYYLCGWQGHPNPAVAAGATARHYRLEGYLDQWYTGRRSIPNRGCYGLSLREARARNDGFERVAETLLFGTTGPDRRVLRACMNRHAVIQGTFPLQLVRMGLRGASVFLPKAGVYAALYYRGFARIDPSIFDRPFHYRHPITGYDCFHSIADLANTVRREATELFGRLAAAAHAGDLANALAARTGRSLETGLPAGDRRPMRYADTDILPLGP